MAVGHMLVAGRYRLREPVGTGGMGRVWLARDEMLDRDVAVKEFVPPEWMTEDEKSRLTDRTLREARSAARLNHPHVVRIYDVVHADDQPWIVMEYVPSRSLHQVITEDGPFAPVEAARIGLAVLDALAAAHRAGVLHRDVKPHNVLIGTDGRVVLTDFGLATFADDGAVTGPGLVVGSPQYVSPERARDGVSTVESDLWSFGATLYAAVEGRSPYARESAMATLMALATEPPDPPLRAGPLAPVLTGLLRHEPAARLTTAEVERRLRMVVGDQNAGAPVSLPSPRRARDRHDRAPLAVGAESSGGQGVSSAETGGADRPHPSAGAPGVFPASRGADRAVMPMLPAQRTPPRAVPPAEDRADPWPSERSWHFARPRMALAAFTLVAVLGIGGSLAGYLIQRGDDRRATVTSSVPATSGLPSTGIEPGTAASTTGSFAAVACDGPVPPTAPTAPQPGAARGVNGWALMSGWSYFTDGLGFHMPVPDGWSYRKIGTTYCFHDPLADRVLSLDVGRNPAGDPVTACRAEAARLVGIGAVRHYRVITIESKPLLHKAADWEYRYDDPNGVALHAKTRWFATNGKAYAISWATREFDWSSDLSKINMVLSTFYTDGKA